MKRYDEYKDSGVEWIGEVPRHWKSCRFKDFMKLSTTASDSIHKIGLENIESATGRFIETNTEFEGNGVEFKKDSIVYGKLRPYLQKVWLAEFEGNAVGDFFVFNAKSNSCPLYIKYLMLSDGFTKEADGSTFGAKMPRVSSDFILTLHFCLPPIMEQMCIASYLDKKCSEIDNVISAQQKRIALLQELKQSVITHAVTKGLNPNVEMKDSGVEWIGITPISWKYCRFKDFLKLRTEASESLTKIGLENIESKSGKFIETGTEFEGNGVAFSTRNIVYGKLRPYLQKVWLAEFDGNAVGDFFVFETKKNAIPTFIKYLMLSDGFTKEADGSTVGAKMPRVSSSFILTMHYCLPSIEEQQTIVEYLTKRCASLDIALTKAQHQVELLQEYKQSLITEVVTGKRKVS